MKPGHELDALIARKVFGWKTYGELPTWMQLDIARRYIGLDFEKSLYAPDASVSYPEFSTSLDGAFHIACYPMSPLKRASFGVRRIGDGFEAHFGVHTGKETFEYHTATAPTAPHAICLAALNAVGHPAN